MQLCLRRSLGEFTVIYNSPHCTPRRPETRNPSDFNLSRIGDEENTQRVGREGEGGQAVVTFIARS